MSRNDDNSTLVIALLLVGAFLLFVLWISRGLGADFAITLEAVIQSILFTALAGVLIYYLEPPIAPSLTGLLAALWPLWWKVLDSIAAGGESASKAYYYTPQIPWWDTSWTKWTVELILIGVTVLLYIRHRDRYGYS